ncbi:MAG TPA: hypothetical protein VFS40_09875 [Gemmatimonadales bacterium]|nr:hypothetical protein [Gemmatimonadales bacterium]
MTHRWLTGGPRRSARRLASALVLASGLALGAAGCGASAAAGASATSPAASPKETVSAFLQAVADSNLTRMATLWGTEKGAATRTGQPADWERRVLIMQAYLRGTTHKIVAEDKGETDNQRIVHVQIRREDCAYMVPFTTIRSNRDGWLVYRFDLRAAGAPGRPCDDQGVQAQQQ